MPSKPESDQNSDEPKRRLGFPSAVTTLAIVTLLVWVAALFIPPGRYAQDADGSPIQAPISGWSRLSLPASDSSSWCSRRSTASMAC